MLLIWVRFRWNYFQSETCSWKLNQFLMTLLTTNWELNLFAYLYVWKGIFFIHQLFQLIFSMTITSSDVWNDFVRSRWLKRLNWILFINFCLFFKHRNSDQRLFQSEDLVVMRNWAAFFFSTGICLLFLAWLFPYNGYTFTIPHTASSAKLPISWWL